MLGTYDFCGYYENTFQWLEDRGGKELVREYWIDGISIDSQRHARDLIFQHGFKGMLEYWGHTLLEESPSLGFGIHDGKDMIRADMYDCPSKGFLIRNGLEQYGDYCDHCIGWIGPLMKDGGYEVDHEHNHCGQCWWEFRKTGHTQPISKEGQYPIKDARLMPEWKSPAAKIDRFYHATDILDKQPDSKPVDPPPSV